MERILIQRMPADAWARVRDIRLRALAEAPDTFGTLLAEERERRLESWRARLEAPTNATFLASRAHVDIGLVTCAPYEGTAGLFGMWVDPAARKMGVGRALVSTVIEWARRQGHASIRLDVADANDAAIRLYESCGFQPNGNTSTLPPPREHVREHQRELHL